MSTSILVHGSRVRFHSGEFGTLLAYRGGFLIRHHTEVGDVMGSQRFEPEELYRHVSRVQIAGMWENFTSPNRYAIAYERGSTGEIDALRDAFEVRVYGSSRQPPERYARET